ncbi:hypothetical protein Mapa_011763 [Marchantia paleacea]|nr:hypothetical protein Mapa_011763 [Marchantia paleacea]
MSEWGNHAHSSDNHPPWFCGQFLFLRGFSDWLDSNGDSFTYNRGAVQNQIISQDL